MKITTIQKNKKDICKKCGKIKNKYISSLPVKCFVCGNKKCELYFKRSFNK